MNLTRKLDEARKAYRKKDVLALRQSHSTTINYMNASSLPLGDIELGN